jgi:hypothetical protein
MRIDDFHAKLRSRPVVGDRRTYLAYGELYKNGLRPEDALGRG